MKKIIFTCLMISLFAFCEVSAQTGSTNNNAVGKWKFEAPLAPEGYNTGNITISFAENKYSSAVSMTGSDYVIPGDKTKVENDTVSFVLFLDGTEIVISLKAESNTKMTGVAIAPDGEIPLTLTKDVPRN
jgi:hypothetical protein